MRWQHLFTAGMVAGGLLVGLPASAQDPPHAAPAPAAPPPSAPLPSGFVAPGPPPGPPPVPPPAPAGPPQGETVAPPPGPPPPPPPAPPAEGEKKADGDKDKKDEVKDGVRIRGGFSINGGIMILPNNASTIGPAIGFGLRLGVQINHYFGVVYQNSPIVTFTAQSPMQSGSGLSTSGSAGFKAGFADYNSVLAMVTLGHFFDIGAGPSLDFLAVANETGSISIAGLQGTSQTSSGISAGAHARIAFNIGGLNGNGPRRSGFSIGVDAHPLFTGAGKGVSLTAGLGGEWY